MGTFEQRDGSGVLFKNNRKTSPKAPDYTGNALINGVEMDVAAWVKEGRIGKFFSMSIKPKDEAQRPNNRPTQSRQMNDEDDGLPF